MKIRGRGEGGGGARSGETFWEEGRGGEGVWRGYGGVFLFDEILTR